MAIIGQRCKTRIRLSGAANQAPGGKPVDYNDWLQTKEGLYTQPYDNVRESWLSVGSRQLWSVILERSEGSLDTPPVL